MSGDERTTYKVIALKGSENYEDWKLSILSVLLSKDILDFVTTTKATTEAKDKRDAWQMLRPHHSVALSGHHLILAGELSQSA
jgi:hypothetical protein